jgi:hypothetical protein
LKVRSEARLVEFRADPDLTRSLEILHNKWRADHIQKATSIGKPLTEKQEPHAGFLHGIRTGAHRSIELWDLAGLEYYHKNGQQ